MTHSLENSDGLGYNPLNIFSEERSIMARVYIEEANGGAGVELKVEAVGLVRGSDDVLKEIRQGGNYFQPYLDDIEWSIAYLVEQCFDNVEHSTDVKHRLQVAQGTLADLILRFSKS